MQSLSLMDCYDGFTRFPRHITVMDSLAFLDGLPCWIDLLDLLAFLDALLRWIRLLFLTDCHAGSTHFSRKIVVLDSLAFLD
jgi:hypothetical protein